MPRKSDVQSSESNDEVLEDNSDLIDDLEFDDRVEREACEDSYYEFFKAAWDVIEPETPLDDNWHIKYLCDILQAEVERIAARRKREHDLIINISPRSSKSTIVSICLAPWAWIKYPWLKFINSSHSMDLSTEHCVKGRDLIQSDWYQDHWSDRYQMKGDQNVKTHYANTRGGVRYAASVGKKISGKGADMIIPDDLIDPEDFESEAAIKAAVSHYNSLYGRLNNKKVGMRVMVMQRVAEEDPTGVELKRRPQKYKVICLPAEMVEGVSEVNPPELKEFYVNGLMDVNRLDREILDESKDVFGDWKYGCLFLQNPTSHEGIILKREWWQTYEVLPRRFDKIIQVWDMTFKGDAKVKKKKKTDFVVGQVWGKIGAESYLIEQVRGRWDFTETIEQVRLLTEKHPLARAKYVEDKANGPAVISALKKEIPGLIAWPPDDEPELKEFDKVARANAVTPWLKAGNIYIPAPALRGWVYAYIDEHAIFPFGANDDQVDGTTCALLVLYGRQTNRLRKLMER